MSCMPVCAKKQKAKVQRSSNENVVVVGLSGVAAEEVALDL
jgi:hypothetical protein